MKYEDVMATPLPKLPDEITFSVHYLAVDGVQPAIRENPLQKDSKSL